MPKKKKNPPKEHQTAHTLVTGPTGWEEEGSNETFVEFMLRTNGSDMSAWHGEVPTIKVLTEAQLTTPQGQSASATNAAAASEMSSLEEGVLAMDVSDDKELFSGAFEDYSFEMLKDVYNNNPKALAGNPRLEAAFLDALVAEWEEAQMSEEDFDDEQEGSEDWMDEDE